MSPHFFNGCKQRITNLNVLLFCSTWQPDSKFSLPIPMMTLLSSGKFAAGKQNLIKDIFILPQPGTSMTEVPKVIVVVIALLTYVVVSEVGRCNNKLRVVALFSSGIVERAKRERAWNHPTREKAFLAWGDFHARSRCARSTIPEEKWGTTRSLVQQWRGSSSNGDYGKGNGSGKATIKMNSFQRA